jgi:hypothetical protein
MHTQDFHYQVCYKIAFAEYFEKNIDEYTGEIHIKCRKHNWIEAYVGYTYYPQCICCSEDVEARTHEIMLYNKEEYFKKKYDKPGTFQTLVSNDELNDFWDCMEELYPIPEEFI